MTNSKHEFAVYVANLSSQVSSKSEHAVLNNPDVVHRIRSVLRLENGATLVLFDGTQQVVCTIADVNKKTISVRIVSSAKTPLLQPAITFLLPLLKREAFERMIYACVELGATAIQPIITEKSQRPWRNEKELERVQSIMVAAAEQSKQFVIPRINQPCSLPEALQLYTPEHVKLVADPLGVALYEVLTYLHKNMHSAKSAGIVITMGPEGDFTDAEKGLLREASYQSVRLTPTVLRSQQAGALLLGIIRSVV